MLAEGGHPERRHTEMLFDAIATANFLDSRLVPRMTTVSVKCIAEPKLIFILRGNHFPRNPRAFAAEEGDDVAVLIG